MPQRHALSALLQHSRSPAHPPKLGPSELSWVLPPELEQDYGLSLKDRDARLEHRQAQEHGHAGGADEVAEPYSVQEVFR